MIFQNVELTLGKIQKRLKYSLALTFRAVTFWASLCIISNVKKRIPICMFSGVTV